MVSSTKTTATVAPIASLFMFAVYLNQREKTPIRVIADENRHSGFSRAKAFQLWWNAKTKTGTSVMRKGYADAYLTSK